MSGVVTLLTDFGTSDGYVAEIKARLVTSAPGAVLVDIAHDLAPGDVEAASYVLGRTWHRFPAGTVHLAVVDPGVGTARRAIAAQGGGHGFVAPDNGLLTAVLERCELTAVVLRVPEEAAPTFHGRDVFAPAAAALATGRSLAALGVPAGDLVRLAGTKPRSTDAGAIGHVVHVDRFGTLVTDLPATMVGTARVALVAGRAVPIRRTFGDVQRGETVAFVGSGGTLEIAVRDGRADQVLGVGRGTEVTAS